MVEFTKEFQCFFVRLPFKLYFRLRPATKSIKTASGAPRPKSAPRGSKSIAFGEGNFQLFNSEKFAMIPIREPSVVMLLIHQTKEYAMRYVSQWYTIQIGGWG